MTTGERIKQKREELGYTQTDLAEQVGYKSKISISKIEHDIVNLPQSKIVALAKALNVTPEYLIGWETPKKPISNISKEYAKLDNYDKDNVKRYIEFLLESKKYHKDN